MNCLSEQSTIRETSELNLIKLSVWCRDYHNNTRYPSTTFERFAIGIYQLSQGMSWNSTPTSYREYESFAAAVIHFICTAESLDISIYEFLPTEFCKIHSFGELQTRTIDYKRLTYLISAAQQMIFYKHTSVNSTRKSRYNAIILGSLLSELCINLMSSIPASNREEALEQATSIMTKKL